MLHNFRKKIGLTIDAYTSLLMQTMVYSDIAENTLPLIKQTFHRTKLTSDWCMAIIHIVHHAGVKIIPVIISPTDKKMYIISLGNVEIRYVALNIMVNKLVVMPYSTTIKWRYRLILIIANWVMQHITNKNSYWK